jgi:hypothetical protein
MARRRPNRRAPLRGPMLVSAMTRVGRPPLVMTPQRHRKGGGVHRPRMPVRFKAGAHGRRKCRVGEGADCDSVDVRCDDELPVHGRTALGAKVIRDPVAVAGAKRGQLPAVAGEHPRLRSAFYGHLLPRNSRLHAEHAASPLLALVAVAQGYPFWVWAFERDAELSAVACSRTRGHVPSRIDIVGCARHKNLFSWSPTMMWLEAGARFDSTILHRLQERLVVTLVLVGIRL